MMSAPPHAHLGDRLVGEYVQALLAYLDGGGEAALSRAYLLGRDAVARGVGVVEIVLLHQAAVDRAAPSASREDLSRAATFLAETMSPFEMTHRGFQDAAARLERLNRSLRDKNQELEETAKSLQKAKERAEQANHELEAFSYSVSHDLRAPLRSIDGFSHALLEDCADRLNDEGRDHLRRVRAAAERMGQLIDDLLLLSRVARTELRRRDTDLSKIVRSVVEELRGREVGSPTTVTIEGAVVARV
ncbi:MAG TPA: histidine kinase dimerization/phospho-acceptor domain-containing protein, partial [Polyangiaceae bacterium]|nr:histidine kinase dimerization/phospho-acceptor domain-containing protein [Polyangiaceae bacterium]